MWVLGLEQKGHGWFGREKVLGSEEKTFASTGKRRKEEKEKKEEDILVFTPFTWFVKLDRCQNFK